MGNTIADQFDKLSVWSRGEERAPHKPLLVLYALGRWSRGDHAPIPFEAVERDLGPLLKEFGPSRKSYHPEYPFWYLQGDGVWDVKSDSSLKPRKGGSSPSKGDLLSAHSTGRFAQDVRQALESDPKLLGEIANRLLAGHFPESLHSDILDAVGLDPATFTTVTRKSRDPAFRKRIMVAYEYRCAVCSFNVRLGSQAIALDAAHIRWHQAGGPDHETNGLALCVLHHKLFDLGGFTLATDGVLLVSDEVNGEAGFHEALMRHHGKKIRQPQRDEWMPATQHTDWHRGQVFKGTRRSPTSP